MEENKSRPTTETKGTFSPGNQIRVHIIGIVQFVSAIILYKLIMWQIEVTEFGGLVLWPFLWFSIFLGLNGFLLTLASTHSPRILSTMVMVIWILPAIFLFIYSMQSLLTNIIVGFTGDLSMPGTIMWAFLMILGGVLSVAIIMPIVLLRRS